MHPVLPCRVPPMQEDAGEQKYIWGSKFRTSDMQSRVRRFLATYYDPSRDSTGEGGSGQPTYMQLLREVSAGGEGGGVTVDQGSGRKREESFMGREVRTVWCVRGGRDMFEAENGSR